MIYNDLMNVKAALTTSIVRLHLNLIKITVAQRARRFRHEP